MARPVLIRVVTGAAVIVTACILPVEYSVEPAPVNSPPVINTRAVFLDPALGEVDGIIRWDTATYDRLSVTLADIQDADTADTLYLQWFVSYDATVRGLDREAAKDVIPPTGSARRTASFTLTPRHLDDVDAARATARDGGATTNHPYVIEVLVGDRQPAFGAAPTEYPEGVQVARWRWLVARESTGGT